MRALVKALVGATSATVAATTLVAAGPVAHAAAGHTTYYPYGTATSKNHVFKAGCHRYRYHYKVTSPNPHWQIVIILSNPNDRSIANAEFDSAVDPASADAYWTLCKPESQYGRFTMRMKVSVTQTEYEPQPKTYAVKPTHFYLTRPHHEKHRRHHR